MRYMEDVTITSEDQRAVPSGLAVDVFAVLAVAWPGRKTPCRCSGISSPLAPGLLPVAGPTDPLQAGTLLSALALASRHRPSCRRYTWLCQPSRQLQCAAATRLQGLPSALAGRCRTNLSYPRYSI